MADDAEAVTETVELGEDEKKQILAILKERGATRECELCGANKWALGDYLLSPLFVKRIGTEVAANYRFLQTSVAWICMNCGNTKLLNVGVLGAPEVTGKVAD
jgi:hypothetical protein